MADFTQNEKHGYKHALYHVNYIFSIQSLEPFCFSISFEYVFAFITVCPVEMLNDLLFSYSTPTIIQRP